MEISAGGIGRRPGSGGGTRRLGRHGRRGSRHTSDDRLEIPGNLGAGAQRGWEAGPTSSRGQRRCMLTRAYVRIGTRRNVRGIGSPDTCLMCGAHCVVSTGIEYRSASYLAVALGPRIHRCGRSLAV